MFSIHYKEYDDGTIKKESGRILETPKRKPRNGSLLIRFPLHSVRETDDVWGHMRKDIEKAMLVCLYGTQARLRYASYAAVLGS